MLRQRGRHRVEISGFQIPPSRAASEINRSVRFGHAGEFRTHLDGGQTAGLTHRVQQVDAHGARSGSGFQHVHAGTNVTQLNHLGNVLRIHDLRAARHRQHIVGQPRTHYRELPSTDGARALPRLVGVAFRMVLVNLGLTFGAHRHHHGSLQLPDHVVVQNDAM